MFREVFSDGCGRKKVGTLWTSKFPFFRGKYTDVAFSRVYRGWALEKWFPWGVALGCVSSWVMGGGALFYTPYFHVSHP